MKKSKAELFLELAKLYFVKKYIVEFDRIRLKMRKSKTSNFIMQKLYPQVRL